MFCRRLVTAALLLQTLAAIFAQTQPVAYEQAVQLYNLGKYPEARDRLQILLSHHPEEFRAYRTYWDLLARTRDNAVRLARVKEDLSFLEQVAAGKRTEEYYKAYEYGLELTGNTAFQQSVHRELLSRYPSGMAAQQDFLNRAKTESDPVKAADLYANFLARFSGNVSWTELAARDRFLLIAKNPSRFSSAQLLSASEDWEKHQLDFVRQFGMPHSYLQALETVAKQLVSSDPVHALDYCDKGVVFVESEWTKTDEFDENYRIRFWPIALQAQVQLRSWQPAVRLGKALVKQIEAATFLGQESDRSLEAEVRLNLERAMEMANDLQHGFEETGLAAMMLPIYRPALQAFLVRHPEFQSTLTSSQSAWQAQIAAEQEHREDRYRQTVLSRQVQKPATPFHLPLLSGRFASLRGYAGTPLVLAFGNMVCTLPP